MFYIFYGLFETWKNRKPLSKFLGTSPSDLYFTQDTVLNRPPQEWFNLGVRVLVLDFDGVLASHGGSTLSPNIFNWLKASVRIFGSDKVFILSNRQDSARDIFFKTQFPGVMCYKSAQKKPYPGSLLEISKQTHCPTQDILIIDDRLTTGILAGILAETRACWVRQPFQDFKKRRVIESYFWILRKLERIFLGFF